MADWNERYVEAARFAARSSKDRSTKVGAVLYDPVTRATLVHGFNGFPRRVNDDVEERHERPLKYSFTEHAERNVIYMAACQGIRLQGLGMAVDWFPCADCARGIIQCGLAELTCVPPDLTLGGRWVDSHTVSLIMLREAGIKLIYVEKEVPLGKAH